MDFEIPGIAECVEVTHCRNKSIYAVVYPGIPMKARFHRGRVMKSRGQSRRADRESPARAWKTGMWAIHSAIKRSSRVGFSYLGRVSDVAVRKSLSQPLYLPYVHDYLEYGHDPLSFSSQVSK